MTERVAEAAIPVHHTGTTSGSWDAGANVRRIPSDASERTLHAEYAWVNPDADPATKAAYKLPHHVVSSDGSVGAANVRACQAGIAVLNGSRGGVDIPAADRQAVYDHLAAHLRDAGVEPAPLRSGEALVSGRRSYSDTAELVRDALMQRLAQQAGGAYTCVCICDLTDTDVVYTVGDSDSLFQASYSIADDGTVVLGEPTPVVRTYTPVSTGQAASLEPTGSGEPPVDVMGEAATESRPARVRVDGRVLEARGTASDGGRIFGVRIIAYGNSRNGRRYPESVMRAAAPLYEGAKVFDHHRDDSHMSSGSIAGLVGQIRGVHATSEGLDGELHLLPSATHVAEALDASLAAEAQGLPPLVGISHDVMAQFRPVVEGGRRVQEATRIVSVNSADVVADPAAGGRATRAIAGGISTSEESDMTVTADAVLAALRTATDEQLAAVGLDRAKKTETEERTVETGHSKSSVLGRLMVREAVTAAGLPETAVDAVTQALPDRITESDVDRQIAAIKAGLGLVERAGLAPTVTAHVTAEAVDKKRAALDAMLAGDYANGYRSFREAFVDFTGRRPRSFDEDFNRTILRETLTMFDSGMRSTEALDSASWGFVLGDSITRRMVAEYRRPSLQTWRQIVSSTPPINDFRTQRIERIGGYGTLPAVAQGATYQPLTSPDDEEVTYAITKRGGTESITLEMIADDDIRAIQRIPVKLGLAAAQTLYRFVFDLLRLNGTIYDGAPLFDATHNNATASAALSQSSLSAARAAMRAQTGFGDTADILSIVPRTLVVPSSLEEIAFQLTTSAVAVPSTSAGPSDTPNIHRGMDFIVVDYFPGASGGPTTNHWFVVADPSMVPTIEVGFYQGRQDPELFTQSDPTVGSMFDADKVTYKIRHIYSGAVLDFRGFYRAGIP